MFLILIISQIVNLKTIWDVLGLKKCYQCGGETLDPVVKHSVSDSNGAKRVLATPWLPVHSPCTTAYLVLSNLVMENNSGYHLDHK